MKRLILLCVMTFVLTACMDRQQKADMTFTHDVMLPITPVKDQQGSSLCWAYAMLATIETEHLVQGDSVNLSVDFTARHLLVDEARKYYLSQGQHPISMRGMATRLLHSLERDGMVTYDSYHSTDCNYPVLMRKLMKSGQVSVNRRAGLTPYMAQVEQLLDDAIRPMPRYQFMYGAEYTAREFAHSVCRRHEYEALTSFTHHPFGSSFVLEVEDNVMNDTFKNVPMKQLLARVEKSIREGHPVCWEGDVSEPGFDFQHGTATIEAKSSQQLRQQQFEKLQTTDDHCMALVGLAHDGSGAPYFICKNSWGTGNPYGGLMYMSFDYFCLKTIAVVMHRN
jgi:bleomycin hydrolase